MTALWASTLMKFRELNSKDSWMFLLLKNYPAKPFSPGVKVICPPSPSSCWLGCHMLSSKPWSQVWHVPTFVLPPVSQSCQAQIVSPQATFNPQFKPKSACTTSPPALTLCNCLTQTGFCTWDPNWSVSAALCWEGDQGEQVRLREEKQQQQSGKASRKFKKKIKEKVRGNKYVIT